MTRTGSRAYPMSAARLVIRFLMRLASVDDLGPALMRMVGAALEV